MSKEIEVKKNDELMTDTFAKEAIKYLDIMGITSQLTPEQKEHFTKICQIQGLNPFKKEIYPVVYKVWDKDARKYSTTLSIVVGYEVYLKRAERSHDLNGWEWKTDGQAFFMWEKKKTKDGGEYNSMSIDRDKSTLTATVTIYRKSWDHPFVHTIDFVEHGGDKGLWEKMPKYMLKKVALCQAMRLCFPEETDGLPYAQEETEYITIPKESNAESEPLAIQSNINYQKELAPDGISESDKLYDEIEKLVSQKCHPSEIEAFTRQTVDAVNANDIKALQNIKNTLESRQDMSKTSPQAEPEAQKEAASNEDLESLYLEIEALVKTMEKSGIESFEVASRREASYRKSLGADSVRQCQDAAKLAEYRKRLSGRVDAFNKAKK